MEVSAEVHSVQEISLDNVNALLKQERKISKSSVADGEEIKIAVLGSCNIQYFCRVLKTLLFYKKINACIYEGEYDGIKMAVYDTTSSFYKYEPDIVIILPDYRDLKSYTALFSSESEVEKNINDLFSDVQQLWDKIHERLPKATIFFSNYVVPIERMLGNLESNYQFSRQYTIQRLNLFLIQKRPDYVLIIDLEYYASLCGKKDWFDESGYAMNKLSFTLKQTGYVVNLFVRAIMAYTGRINKCLVLDLDNTLWGGVLADEGVFGIQISPTDAVGETYLAFQRYIKDLKRRGVILAVCSKNDMDIAKEAFNKNPYMILKLEDFVCFYANWEDKATNIKRIAEEVNIGVDSIVFFDDNPVERDLVKQLLPEVTVIEVPRDPAEYCRAIELSNAFYWSSLTQEDISRIETYNADAKRNELKKSIINYDEYLCQLEMKCKIQGITKYTISRFSQLVNKSNQFNLRTIRYSESEIENLSQDSDYKLLTVSLVDKFSNYGIISCVILHKVSNICFIDTWVMSCRVLKRGIEYITFNRIYEEAKSWNCSVIEGEYIPTAKNKLVSSLFEDLDFILKNSQSMPQKYAYKIENKPIKKYFIEEVQ